jgi:tetratricopeptide (TPR) repeat protein/predicted Ser/Thr protein kinase
VTAGAGYRWDEADRLFDQALDVPPAERARWLDQACGGNAALRAQVEALLRADASAERFLELDAMRCAEPLLNGPEAEGLRIGPYRVVRELGRGGMGVVYLAERSDGQFQQRVALKLIKRGMDSDEIHRRFLAERQILAQLNHPHIARLLDGGVTGEGQPWFAIEYVDGRPITAHCDARRLGPEERLRLFLDVCDAVRYAHQNLVVHRDLKPSNILVTAEGRAKLLDFGIAKLLREEPGAEAGLTRTGLQVMTPQYAAPEQVSGGPVTTATDVYALGAVLYELLTGRRAHRLDSYTPTEVERVVCQVEPEAPSAAAAGALRKRLRGDLDTITLTALQKAPDRRYSTVEQLAADIRRHLDGLPVSARPDTIGYRAAKFVRRHRLGVVAGAAVALSLVAGLAGTAWQARVAAERARTASAEAAKERAVRDFLVRLFQASAPQQALGREVTARELLDRGRHELDTALVAQPAVRSELLSVVANVYSALGLAPQSDTLFGQAVALMRTLPGNHDAELSAALLGWGSNLMVQSRFDEVEPLFQEAVDRLRRREPEGPDLAPALRGLGRVQTYTGNHAKASALLREALAIDLRYHGAGSWQVAEDSDVLGYELLREGQVSAADTMIGAALAIRRRVLPADHPSLLWTVGNLAAVRRAQGNDAEAERLFEEVLAGQRRIFPNGHSELVHTLVDLGDLLAARGRFAEAESLLAPEAARHRALLGPDNDHAAMLLERLAGYRYQLGHYAAAERDLRDALGTWQRTLGPEHRHTLHSTNCLGVYLREQGRYREAEALIRQSLAGLRKTVGDSQPDVAEVLRNLGVLKRMTRKPAEAERLLREALAIQRAKAPEGDEETARTLGELGYTLALEGRHVEAERLLLEADRELAKRSGYRSEQVRREIQRRLAEVRRRT